jgi:hypothetical protein
MALACTLPRQLLIINPVHHDLYYYPTHPPDRHRRHSFTFCPANTILQEKKYPSIPQLPSESNKVSEYLLTPRSRYNYITRLSATFAPLTFSKPSFINLLYKRVDNVLLDFKVVDIIQCYESIVMHILVPITVT